MIIVVVAVNVIIFVSWKFYNCLFDHDPFLSQIICIIFMGQFFGKARMYINCSKHLCIDIDAVLN
jgi:hypothetical protein